MYRLSHFLTSSLQVHADPAAGAVRAGEGGAQVHLHLRLVSPQVPLWQTGGITLTDTTQSKLTVAL